MEQFEFIITVNDPMVWDELWEELTIDGLGNNFIPSRDIKVLNDRPFNEYCAHFSLTVDEANSIKQDIRVSSIELKASLQDDVYKEFLGKRYGMYDKSQITTNDMKNWGLIRATNDTNPFTGTYIRGDYQFSLDGTGVDIIVIDSGIEPDHPEFAVNPDGTGGTRVVDFDWSSLGVSGVYDSEYYGGYLGDSDGHGSHCASIAAGNTCGWASGAAIYSIRIFAGYDIKRNVYLSAIDSDYAFDLVKAFHLRKLAEGNIRPTICTNSWGYAATYSGMQYTVYRGTQYSGGTYNVEYGQVNSRHPYSINYINAGVNSAAAAGVIMVGAAGNYRHKIDVLGGIDYDNYYRYYSTYWGTEDVYYHRGSTPTNASSMICVGAVDSSNVEQKAYFSETGPRVDVYAPGVMIMGAYDNSSYITSAVPDPRNSGFYLNKISGTSQATPQVTGLLACVLQARPEMTAAEAKEFLHKESLKDRLVVTGAETWTNNTSLQGGENKILYTPFTKPVRGNIGSKE